jgi:DNA-binding transcriptional regulator YdaS (Cro superfamily)
MTMGLRKALDAAGSRRKLARILGVSHQAMSKWHDVPAHWIIRIEQVTGVPREELRPDLYRLRDKKER